MDSSHNAVRFLTLLFLLCVAAGWPTDDHAADHGDTPLLKQIGRHDARLAGLFAFLRGTDLVIIATVDPTISGDVEDWSLSPDVRIDIMIDNDSVVSFDDPDDLAAFGGTIERPEKIREDMAFRIRMDEHDLPKLTARGLHGSPRDVLLFMGPRDDPFIRGPRIGRNIGAIVLQLPLERVLNGQDTILVWATSAVEDVHGRFQELAGRALRSQFPENDLLNIVHPKKHFLELGVQPDVMIFDTSRLAAFPNGRELTDDVVDLVDDERVLANDDPFPDENDVAFLNDFPYLATPHPSAD